jgi:hypothetical protein
VTPLELGFLAFIVLWLFLDSSLLHDMKSSATAALARLSIYDLIVVVGGYGWVRNIIDVVHSDFSHVDGGLVVRVIGIPFVPVGAVAGWIP